jgi:arginase family enzyme
MTDAWPNLSNLFVTADVEAPIGLVGAPLAAGSVTPGRCDLAPGALRAVLKRIGRFDVDSLSELSSLIADHGDVSLGGLDIEGATDLIRRAMRAAAERHPLALLIGGNNAVTRPGLLGMADALGLGLDKVGLITLDAHFDMRGMEQGLSNGNPVRALIEDGLPGQNVAQIGLAPFANSRAMHDFADEQGCATLGPFRRARHGAFMEPRLRARAAWRIAKRSISTATSTLSIARSSPQHRVDEPTGFRPGNFFAAVRWLAGQSQVRAIDLTEWDPPLDSTDLSALTTGRWLAEVVAGFETRS